MVEGKVMQQSQDKSFLHFLSSVTCLLQHALALLQQLPSLLDASLPQQHRTPQQLSPDFPHLLREIALFFIQEVTFAVMLTISVTVAARL